MKPPKAPTKPTKPNKPPEIIDDSIIVKLEDHSESGKNIAALLEEHFPGISLAEILLTEEKFEDHWSDTDYCYRACLVYRRQAPNPKYDELMTKYHKKLEEYEQARRQYKLDVEKYKEDLALWHKQELEKLDGSI